MAKVSCVDISEFQQGINFNKMKSDGIKAVIIRAGYGRESSQKDSMFESHYKNAKSENMMIGVYWYSYADSVGDAEKRQRLALNALITNLLICRFIMIWKIIHKLNSAKQNLQKLRNAFAKRSRKVTTEQVYMLI